MIKISVSGGRGKMGRRVCYMVRENPDLELVSIIERPGHEDEGKIIDGVKVFSDISKGIEGADVVIDFSNPKSSMALVQECLAKAGKVVIGTTGLSDDQKKLIEDAAREIPVLFSPNMSVGVNLVFNIAAEIARKLPGYEKEIIEAHHNRKVDSPSGTAMKLAQIISSTEDKLVYGRQGNVGPRQSKEVGVHAVRGGNIVGEHTVMWIGPHDRIELTHRAQSRDVFASGAVQAGIWLSSRKPGRLYTMEDVLS